MKQQPMRVEDTLRREPASPAYALPPETVLRQEEVNLAYGLSEQEADLRLKRYGPNTLMAHPQRTASSAFATLHGSG